MKYVNQFKSDRAAHFFRRDFAKYINYEKVDDVIYAFCKEEGLEGCEDVTSVQDSNAKVSSRPVADVVMSDEYKDDNNSSDNTNSSNQTDEKCIIM